ncbi:MAG: hypothetical protein V1910_02695 [bacterium]
MSLSEKQFKFAYWFLVHKKKIRSSIVIGLIILNIILISILTFKIVFYFKDQKNYQTIVNSLSKNLIDYGVLREKNKPKDLSVLLTESVIPNRQKYDVISQVENLNSQWAAQYDYQFILDGREGKVKTNFILPNEKKFLLDFGFESLTKNPAVELKIKNVQWKRTRYLSKIPKIQFEVKNVKYFPIGIQITSDKKSSWNQVNFEAINNSSYGIWETFFKVILYQGKKIVGVNTISAKQFLSKEKRSLSTNWVNFLPSVTEVFIEPEVNTLDSKNFMSVK